MTTYVQPSVNSNEPALIKASAPTRTETWTMRILIIVGLLAMINFLFWFFQPEHIGYKPLYWVLNFIMFFKLMRMLHEWYHYFWISVPPTPVLTRDYTVDMVTTFCPGEPYDMVINTLKAMKAITYPHETYLCDEGDDPYLKEVCAELGVHHVYRGKIKTDAKAGNVNYALRTFCKGEITIILDPDHIPIPEFIDRVLPYFEDPQIGYVQTVQGYYNRNESFVAKGAAEQTYLFYGPMMMTMNSYGTAQAIGANCAFRRSALDSIGGHAPGLSEDMHTAMQLHAKGWKSVYVPEVLTRGLVPATMSAYYKQQIKWSRGTFELLFRVYPKLFKNFTLTQKIHYGILPFYYLCGLIGLLDILVPIISLIIAQVPWRVDLLTFMIMLLPMVVSAQLIRQFSQRWVLEEHERGFHMLGGTLQAGTWWVFLIGFIYSIFNIKVPYLPTPKGDAIANEWKISLPNIGACLVSLAAIVYGLSIDYNPFSMVMAGFAGINILILGFVVIMGQQKALQRGYKALYGKKFYPVRSTWYRFRHNFLYRTMRNGYSIGAIVLLIGFVCVAIWYGRPQVVMSRLAWNKLEPSGAGYHAGAVHPAADQNVAVFDLGTGIRWEEVQAAASQGQTPFLYWDLLQRESPEAPVAVLEGIFSQIRMLETAVFVCLPPSDSLTPAERSAYAARWRQVHAAADAAGAANIAWVWTPDTKDAVWPGDAYVDWIGYEDHTWKAADHTFSQGYDPIRAAFGTYKHPVMIVSRHPQAATQNRQTLDRITQTYPEIRGIVAQYTGQAAAGGFSARPAILPEPHAAWQITRTADKQTDAASSAFRRDDQGQIEWIVDGQPFYIKGIAYHPMPHWYEGGSPLTRKQLERDFSRIKAMGANTIRRYDAGIYDHNVLNIAAEYDLKVLYGFDLSPTTDYLKDTAAVARYRTEILTQVARHKHKSAVLGWTLGNETWILMTHTFRQPYLTQVRRAYLQFLEQITQEIHALDPAHPVVLMAGGGMHLPAALEGYKRYVPSADIIGVNALYETYAATLDSTMQARMPGKPYFVAAFGPDGYWDPEMTDRDENRYLAEPSSYAKAHDYYRIWNQYIEPHRGHNLGGFAYSWRDQHEGTSSWYGLTDFKSRLKPGYYALKEAWTGEKTEISLADAYISPGDPFWYRKDNITIRCASENNRRDVKIRWYLSEESVDGPQRPFRTAGEGPVVDIQLPDKEKTYRVYLYINDKQGNVVSASTIVNPHTQRAN